MKSVADSDIEKYKNELIPSEFYLSQNYPNPFKDKTTIKYCIAFRTRVVLTIFNSEGKEKEKLVDEEKKAGTYAITWNAENLQSGVYCYQLKAGKFIDTKKMVLLR
jgi:hypothetical protein